MDLSKGEKIKQIESYLAKFDAASQSQAKPCHSRSPDQRREFSHEIKRQKSVVNFELRTACISNHGLVSNDIRNKVWPIILNLDFKNLPKKPNRTEIRETQKKDLNQVQLDVNRCVSRLPENLPREQQHVLQENLTDLILWVLSRNQGLNYYQGYHDIAVTVLQVTGMRLAMPVVEKLTIVYLRDFMQSTMESTKHVLNLIFPIIQQIDPYLHEFLQKSEVGSYFALSWLITWYGHVVKNMLRTTRMYDFFLACHPAMPIYLAAEIVMYRREQILDTDCDMPSVHHVLTSLAKEDNLPDEELIEKAVKVFIENPPTELLNSPDYQEELQFYSKLIMAGKEEKTETLEEAVLNSTSTSAPGLSRASSSNNLPGDSLRLRRRTKSFIEERRKENLKKARPGQGLLADQNESKYKKRGKLLRRAITFFGATSIAVVIVSFWWQNIVMS